MDKSTRKWAVDVLKSQELRLGITIWGECTLYKSVQNKDINVYFRANAGTTMFFVGVIAFYLLQVAIERSYP